MFDDFGLTSLIARRVFFVPAKLTFDYFEFFSYNPHVYWSNSILKLFISYPYDYPVGEVIGNHLGKTDLNANNGFVSTGFSHAGYFGIAIYIALVGALLRFLDYITNGFIPLWAALGLTVIPLRSFLISTDVFTTLLTHGLLVVFVILFLLRNQLVEVNSA